jgi:hypothetical protein
MKMQLHNRAVAAIAALALSSLASVAHAKQGHEAAAKCYGTPMQVIRSMAIPLSNVGVPRNLSFPEGSADYHGSNGG